MTALLYDNGSLILYNNALAVDDTDLCDCECGADTGTCGCDDLPSKLYVKLRRVGGDWSDCGAGEWTDDEEFEVNETALGDIICTETNARKWAGTLSCGDEIAFCCSADNDGPGTPATTMSFWVWWCGETLNATDHNDISCSAGAFTFDQNSMFGGTCTCCEPGEFELDVRTTPFP